MCDSKNEYRCSANFPKTSCCVFVNQAITAYFREANGVFSSSLTAILAAFPTALSATQATALRTAAVALVGLVADVPLTLAQAAAINTVVATLVPGLSFTPFVAGALLTDAQVAAIAGLLSFATPPGATPVPVPLTPAQITAIADALNSLVAGAGLGTAFTTSVAAVTTEASTRTTSFKATFDEINRLALEAFRKLLDDKCNPECCESAADAVRSIAINFLRTVAGAVPLAGLPAVPPPVPGTPATPGSLQFVLANIVQETTLALNAITNNISCNDCEESCDESCDEICDERNNECDRKVKPKPIRRFTDDCSEFSSESETECEYESESESEDMKKHHQKYHKKQEPKKEEDKKYYKKYETKKEEEIKVVKNKKDHSKKDECDECPPANWKPTLTDVKW